MRSVGRQRGSGGPQASPTPLPCAGSCDRLQHSSRASRRRGVARHEALGALAAIKGSLRPEPFASGFGAASAPVYALDRLSSSGSNTPVWMYSDGRMDGVSFGLVGSLEIAWDTRKHDVK